MTDRIVIRPQVVEGFEAYKAGSELYRRVAEAAAEKFGRDSRAYVNIMNGINVENATGSQFFFNTQMGLCLPEGQRVMTFEDLQKIYCAKPDFFDGIYADTSELVLRSATPSWEPNKQILENLVRQVKDRRLEFSSDNPLVISGARLVGDDDKDNRYGLLLTLGEGAEFRNDPRFAYENDSIPFGNGSKKLWTRQDGLFRLYLDRVLSLDSYNEYLSDSDDDGRVVVFAPQAHAGENLEFEAARREYIQRLDALEERIRAEKARLN